MVLSVSADLPISSLLSTRSRLAALCSAAACIACGKGTGAIHPTNDVPVITGLTPPSVLVGKRALTLAVIGNNFLPSSTLLWNDTLRPATYINPTQVAIVLSAADLANANDFKINVVNPPPGGGPSKPAFFSVNNPLPTLSELIPDFAITGGAAFTLLVNGGDFVSGALLRWGDTTFPTTVSSRNQLTATIPGSAIAAAGVLQVAVSNPASGEGSATPLSFTVKNDTPFLKNLNPSSVSAGGSAFTLTVSGTGFGSNSTVEWASAKRTTHYLSATALAAEILVSDVALANTFNITVTTPAPGGGTSAPLTLTVNNPAPTVTSIGPTSANIDDAALTLAVNGTNFVRGSTVNWNNDGRPTTYVSSTQLTVPIQTSDLLVAGASSVTVTNGAPGGGTSTAQFFTVNNLAPTTRSLNPAVAAAGDPALSVRVTGSNFVSGSVVKWNGSARTTSYESGSQVTAMLTPLDLATPGKCDVTVTNGAPGGGTSQPLTFTVQNPAPTVSSLSPTFATVGDAPLTVTIKGTNFVPGSTAKWSAAPRPTSTVSSTQLITTLSTSDLTTAGKFDLVVTNAVPGGGTSAPLTFTVNNPVPTVSDINPKLATLGDPAPLLTVSGTGFTFGSTVNWGGSPRKTVYLSSTQLTAQLLAADFATPGTVSVTATTPGPGGGTSTEQTFTVNNPVPTLSSMGPATANVGDNDQTLTLTGKNFIASSTVKWNGVALTTTYVSDTQLSALLPAANLAVAGKFACSVFNGVPGGGNSAGQSFTVKNLLPVIGSMSPLSANAGDPALTITVNGAGFVNGSLVSWNGSVRTTTYVTSSQLTAALLLMDLAAAGTFNVSVTTPGPGGGTAQPPLEFKVYNLAPITRGFSPASANVGDAVTLSVFGQNFVNGGSTVNWNNSTRPTIFVSTTELRIDLTSADLALAGTFNAAVTTLGPGGGTSNPPLKFTVNNLVPIATSLSVTAANVGDPQLTLTVIGKNFVNGNSTVNWNNSSWPTNFVSSTRLTILLTAADFATAGTSNVTVTTSGPGGGTSDPPLNFTVNNLLPTVTSIGPASANVGDTPPTLTVNGTNFVSGSSTVTFGGTARTTTYLGPTQLSIKLTSTDLATAGTASVTVTTTGPGGGTSGQLVTFTVNNLVPTVTSIGPASANVGDTPPTLTVNGTNFVSGSSTVTFGGTARTTTYLGPTQLSIKLTSTDLATAAAILVTVTTTGPGGGSSGAQTFNVKNPAPATASVSPTCSSSGGSSPLLLTVNGSGFVATSIVNWAGKAQATTYFSGTRLTASIGTADLAMPGTFNVTVTNTSPGGGTSTAAQGVNLWADFSATTGSANLPAGPFGKINLSGGAILNIAGGSTVTVCDTVSVIGNSTLLLQSINTSGQVNGAWAGQGVTMNAANINVENGSKISADGQGYGGGTGSVSGPGVGPGGGMSGSDGANTGAGGGSYGGLGGHAGDNAPSGVSGVQYGRDAATILGPTLLGSGGGASGSGSKVTGKAGGGAIRLVVSNTLTNNGTISANGLSGGQSQEGAGAGGSLYITAGTLAGSGTGIYQASGGNNTYIVSSIYGGGAGGGGRIAIYYGVASTPNQDNCGMQQAYASAAGGSTAATSDANAHADMVGHPGTIRFINTSVATDSNPDLTILCDTTWNVSYNFNGLSIPSGVTLSLGGGTTLTVAGLLNITGGTLQSLGTNLDLATGGQGATVVAGNITLDSNSRISADAQGYSQGQGPKPGLSKNSNWGYGGGGYGGSGGNGSNGFGGGTYGLQDTPVDLGSGGGAVTSVGGSGSFDNGTRPAGAGGGAIKLVVSGTLTNGGTISANGEAARGRYSGGGAGGSVWVSTATIAGGGVYQGLGGSAIATYGGGGGGGGRVKGSYTSTGSGFVAPTAPAAVAGGSGDFPGSQGSLK